MTDSDEGVPNRTRHTAPADTIRVRQETTEVDGESVEQFVVRMPITSTAEARDGVAFDREKVEGFARQIEEGGLGSFVDHGRNDQTGHRYSALGKLSRITDPEVVTRDEATDLDVDFRFPMPDEVVDGAETMREMLATLYTQARANIPLTSSIGWSEETGERDLPGDADLLEASIVGIPSDSRTTTDQTSTEPALARAVSAASEDFDVGTFVRELERENRNTVEVGGEEIDLTPPDAVQNAATVALAKDDELEPDCGTGEGRQSARDIAADDVSAERIDDIAAYLTSHEEDVTADGPPTDWSDEEWQDCGNLQYALWGGTGTGTGLEWAQSKANDVHAAQGEDLPYPDRAARNLDDPEFSEGDAVEWSSNDTTVRGRVADVGDEFTVGGGDVTITGDEGEAVYLIHELDDSLEPPQYRRENVAKPESSLDESAADLPPLEGNFADDNETENSMSDSDTPDEESGDTERDEQPDLRAMEEKMEEMRGMIEENTRMTEEVHREMVDGEEDEDDGDEDGEESADADAADEHDESPDEDRTVTLDGEELAVDEASERIADLRDEAADADPADPETQDRVADEDVDGAVGGRGADDIDWRA